MSGTTQSSFANRALDANGDVLFGNGRGSYLISTPAAVAQAVLTRLELNLGEWFLDTTDGTAWQTGVLGNYTRQTRDLIVQQRVGGTPYLTAIASYQSVFNGNTRAWSASMVINTMFGTTPVPTVTTGTGVSGNQLTDPSGDLLVDPSGNVLIAPP